MGTDPHRQARKEGNTFSPGGYGPGESPQAEATPLGPPPMGRLGGSAVFFDCPVGQYPFRILAVYSGRYPYA